MVIGERQACGERSGDRRGSVNPPPPPLRFLKPIKQLEKTLKQSIDGD